MCAIEWQQQRREVGFDRKRFRPVILLCGGKLMYFLRLSLYLELENCYITADDTVIVLKITSPEVGETHRATDSKKQRLLCKAVICKTSKP
jgi:hypothetical protein